MTSNRQLVLLVFFLAICTIGSALHACMWDYDTIRDEKRGMPGIAEVLAGRFEKHSDFFYQQRILKTAALVKADPKNLDAWDTLAVAYAKLGDYNKAIETILKKDKISAGQYTTYANLGSFYMLNGDLDDGISTIQKALEINPDAHFGREEYQLKLAIYFRDAKTNPEILKRMNFLEYAGVVKWPKHIRATTIPSTQPIDDPNYDEQDELARDRTMRGWPSALTEMGVKDNVFEGIVGLIRFGPRSSAELYLTLGDLLSIRGDKILAYRAYLRAQELHHRRTVYLETVLKELHDNKVYYKDQVDDVAIAAERANAAQWVKAYQTYEDNLVRTGVDTEEPKNYAGFYAEFGSPVVDPTVSERSSDWRRHHAVELVVTTAFAIPIALYLILRWARRKCRAAA